jgi:RHS repeat-associated protein
VSVTSGNVFLDQTDLVLAGLRRRLALTRSYNSLRAFRGEGGLFGPGWSHSFEKKIVVMASDQVRIEIANGNAVYFVRIATGRYEAYAPAFERSVVIEEAGGVWRRLFRHGGSERYDGSGRLVEQTDRVGNATSLTYDASGRLSAIADQNGRVLRFAYGAGSQPEKLSAPDGVAATYTYAGSGPSRQLASVDYPDGTGYTFTYGQRSQLTVVADRAGRIVEKHDYDFVTGHGLTSELAQGTNRYTFTYEENKTSVTDALGRTATFDVVQFGGVRRIVRVTGCTPCGGGQVEEWTYDDHGRVTSYKDGIGNVLASAWNANGDLVAVTNALNQADTYTYDELGRVLTHKGPSGAVFTYTHRPAGPASALDPLNRTVNWTYDERGLLVRVVNPRGKAMTLAYGANGDLESTTDPVGAVHRFLYDLRGRPTKAIDALGHSLVVDYTSGDRVFAMTYSDETQSVFSYDRSGMLERVRDRSGRETRYTYDDWARMETVLDPLTGITRYGYDKMNRLTSAIDASGNKSTFEYDSHDRLKKRTFPDGAFDRFEYDSAGYLRTYTDRRGVATHFTHDAAGRLTMRTHSDGTPATAFEYDAEGRLTSAANGADTVGWAYDAAGFITTETSLRNASAITYAYTDGGLLSSTRLSGQAAIDYSYDDSGRLISIARGSSSFGFTYDAQGRRATMAYPNGMSTSYTRDPLSQLVSLKATAANDSALTSFSYTYDRFGDRVTMQALDHSESYGYDALTRLVAVERTGVGGNRWSFGYDAAGNRTRTQVGAGRLETSTYGIGNRLLGRSAGGALTVAGTLDEAGTVRVNGQAAFLLPDGKFEATVPSNAGTNTFTIEATDTRGNVRTSTYELEVTGAGAQFGYDTNGNLTSKVDESGTWSYQWDALNRLVRAVKSGGEIARFEYDALGRRVSKVASGVTTSYTYDGEDIIRENRGAEIRTYIHGPGIDEPLAVEQNGMRQFYHADGLGSVVAITNDAGSLLSTRRYDPWGNPEVGADVAGHSFTGREWDPETGLYFYRARYYDPKVGRFIGEDPIGLEAGPNFYAYAVSNPVNFTDPTGLDNFLVLVGTPGEAHNAGSNFVRAAETKAAELRNQGHNVTVTGVTRGSEFMQSVGGTGRPLDGGVIYFGHGGPNALYLLNDEGLYPSTLGSRHRPSRLTGNATIALYSCNTARGGDRSIAALLNKVYGVPVQGSNGPMLFSPQPNSVPPELTRKGAEPPPSGPLYMVPNPGSKIVVIGERKH